VVIDGRAAFATEARFLTGPLPVGGRTSCRRIALTADAVAVLTHT
jgi:hypothetical protein